MSREAKPFTPMSTTCFLGLIVEQVTGMELDAYVEENIYKPLGLDHIVFNPLQKGFEKDQCAATELNGNSRDGAISFTVNRTDTIQGEVHDEKAFYAMNGVSGHAGLFADAQDLGRLAQVMLNQGRLRRCEAVLETDD